MKSAMDLLRPRKRSGAKSGQVRRGPALVEFQTDPIEIEESTPPIVTRSVVYVLAALIVSGTLWASLSKMDEVVVGPGKLVTTTGNLVISPLETSVVRSIDVKVGDIVRKGEPLAHLDPTFTEADVLDLRKKKSSLDAQLARIHAEFAGKLYEAPANANSDEIAQAQLARERRSHYDAQLASYDQKIEQLQAEIATKKRSIDVMKQRLEVLSEVEAIRVKLEQHGDGARLQTLQSRDSRLEVETNLDQTMDSISEYTHQLDGARADRDAFMQKWREDLAQEEVTAERDDRLAGDQLEKAEARHDMTVLTAPTDVAVLEVAPRSVGSVVREADPLFTLVRLDVPLEAEASVESSDIGRLAVGDDVRIKLDAFPFQRHGTLDGKVSVISRDSFSPKDQGGDDAQGAAGKTKPFYRVRVTLTNTKLRNVPPDFHLLPGMSAVSEIKVGSRSLMSYLIYPITRGLDESFHE